MSNTATARILALLLLGLASGCAGDAERSARRTLRDVEYRPPHAERLPEDREVAIRGGAGDYVAYALENSPSLRADYHRWRAAVLRISRARRMPQPVVDYAYYVRRVQTRVGPQRHRLSLRQSIPWPTVLSEGASAAARRAESAAHVFDARVLAVRASVESSFWQLWAVRALRRVRLEQVDLVGDMAVVARGRVATGEATLVDLQQVEVTRARLEDSLAALDEMERDAQARLVAAIGAPVDMRTPIDDTPPEPMLPAATPEQLVELVRQHPDLSALSALSEANRADARRASAEGLPQLTVGLTWIETGPALVSTPGSGDDAVILSVGASVPLQRRSYRDARDAARAAAAATEGDHQALEDELIARLVSELSALRDTHRRITLHRATLIPQALATYEAVLGAYQVGRGSVAATLLAQRDVLELQEALIRLQAQNSAAWARVEALAGQPLELREAARGEDHAD